MGVKELPILKELFPLLEHLPGIQFWMKDKQGRFLAANQPFVTHFRLENFSQMEGKTDFDFSPEHLAREYVQDDEAVLASGRIQAEKIELVREFDQSLHWYATTKIPLRDGKNRAWGTAGITRRIDAQERGFSGIRGMDDAVRHVEKSYGKPIAIGSLAAMVGLSVSQFERKFKALMRESPLKFINRVRIRAACQLLLHTDLSIAEISRSTGFFDQSHFTKRFQAHLRIRPLQYRKKYGQAR